MCNYCATCSCRGLRLVALVCSVSQKCEWAPRSSQLRDMRNSCLFLIDSHSFKPPQVQCEICPFSAQPENRLCWALGVVSSLSFMPYQESMSRLDDIFSLLLSGNQCLIYVNNFPGFCFSPWVDGVVFQWDFMLSLQCHSLFISRLWRILRLHLSKNMDICFIKELQWLSVPFGQAIKLKCLVCRPFNCVGKMTKPVRNI